MMEKRQYETKRRRKLFALSALVLSLAACGVEQEVLRSDRQPPTSAAAEQPVADADHPYRLEGALSLQAFDKDRMVAPDGDESFEFAMINHTDGDLPVVVVLEHQAGERWNTSLCVQQQCLLGNGSRPSVTDPVLLPPYLEQPFQAHVFVAADAEAGDSATLTLRVEPQVDGIEPRSLTLSAQVSPR